MSLCPAVRGEQCSVRRWAGLGGGRFISGRRCEDTRFFGRGQGFFKGRLHNTSFHCKTLQFFVKHLVMSLKMTIFVVCLDAMT